jgi:5-oxoprolinase (ATP-hydrolysing) subunit A
MANQRIDLNVDTGESFGAWRLGDDAVLLQFVSSVNVACGFHAGDPRTMWRTLELAADAGVAVGAHPGYPDLIGFGRREMNVSPENVYADVLYQISALAGLARNRGITLQHVKAHGALYNRAAKDFATAQAIARATKDFDSSLAFVGLPNSELEVAATELGLRFVPEAFCERAYLQNGQLAPRDLPNSSIHDPNEAATRALAMVRGQIETLDGQTLEIRAETLCIHGDNPNAVEIARAVREVLEAEGVIIRAFGVG